MKKLALIFILFSNLSFAQEEKDDYLMYSGNYLIKANQLHTIASITAVGGIAISTSIILLTPKNPTGGLIVMGLSSIASTILYFAAWNNIGKAGQELNKAGLSLNTKEGIGLCYRF
jgi:hypothetical protein